MRPSDRLGYGQFFGDCEVSREVPGFSLSLRTPDRNVIIERHTHEEAHFIVLLDGHYVSSARDAGHIVGGPALIYNPPGTTHRDRFERPEGRFFAVSVARDRHASVASEMPMLPAAVRLARREAVALGQRLVAEQLAWSPGSKLVAEGLCVELLAEVARRAAALPASPPRWLRRVRELLHDRCDEDLSIAALAAEAGVHAIYLARCFRRFFGCAPGDYLRLCRVERARSLLADSRCTQRDRDPARAPRRRRGDSRPLQQPRHARRDPQADRGVRAAQPAVPGAPRVAASPPAGEPSHRSRAGGGTGLQAADHLGDLRGDGGHGALVRLGE